LNGNDGHENDGLSKFQDMKITDQSAGHEIAGPNYSVHRDYITTKSAVLFYFLQEYVLWNVVSVPLPR